MDFMTAPKNETNKEKIDRWKKGIKILDAKVAAGKELTMQEGSWYDFVTYKLEDWKLSADVVS